MVFDLYYTDSENGIFELEIVLNKLKKKEILKWGII